LATALATCAETLLSNVEILLIPSVVETSLLFIFLMLLTQ
jgi:hypothetical protein